MGGFGSGRTARRIKAEHCRSLDVNRLNREGCLADGWIGHWHWHQDGVETARVALRTRDNNLVLSYRVRSGGQDWQDIIETVSLDRVHCTFGGARPFFRCPGVVNGRTCNRRVGKLFGAGRYFLCRHCYGIAYASQSEDRHDRLLRRANKRRVALGGQAGTANFIADKPKGMWNRTYTHTRREIEWCETEADREFVQRFRHLFKGNPFDELFDD